ncbi:unnamed protein product [Clonostachys rosea]|uniref:RRM domain-containing protein n=1 Tax=Bionectria ochroleuca TaxID=29856 RepID=A0ABY6UZK0_BIOOC|nr:unnamed protein product [Clonostachys rosea]
MSQRRYDPVWEARLAPARKARRLLYARNINLQVSRAIFEAGVRGKLSKPDSVEVLWPTLPNQSNGSSCRHTGWAMLQFENRPDCRSALEELQGLEFLGRQVNVEKAGKKAILPASMRQFSAASAPSTNAFTAAPPNPAPSNASSSNVGSKNDVLLSDPMAAFPAPMPKSQTLYKHASTQTSAAETEPPKSPAKAAGVVNTPATQTLDLVCEDTNMSGNETSDSDLLLSYYSDHTEFTREPKAHSSLLPW